MAVERNPQSTRLKILQAGFQEIHKHGFQGMRVDKVLECAELKKGAFYHHFPSKQALGYAVLEEIIENRISELWIKPLGDFKNPLEGIHSLFINTGKTWSDAFFTLGCPLNNLAQEMSPIDEGFRNRIQKFYFLWLNAIAQALTNGQTKGLVKDDIDPEVCAVFILATIEGALGMAKNHQDKTLYFNCGRELQRYLQALQAP